MISLTILSKAIIGNARMAIKNKIYSEMHAQKATHTNCRDSMTTGQSKHT
jgi:hypothetical protein